MAAVEPVRSAEIFSVTVVYHPDRGHVSLWTELHGEGNDEALWHERRKFVSLNEGVLFGEACLWAWTTTGLVGLAAFCASQPVLDPTQGP